MSTCSPSEQDEGILTCEEGQGSSQEVQGSLTAGEGEEASQQVFHDWSAFLDEEGRIYYYNRFKGLNI
jgi:hypothetical protein